MIKFEILRKLRKLSKCSQIYSISEH